MRKHRISDDDASALVKGRAPAARPDLALLAQSVTDFRAAAFETLPQPSAELASRLDLARASRISTVMASLSDSDTMETQTLVSRGPASQMGRVKRMFSWLLGLGLATKIALGATVAAAAVTGGGAAGVLPFGAQDAFDTVVSVVMPTEEADDETTEPGTTDGVVTPGEGKGTFGESVSERAHELGKDGDGRSFGEEISEEAQKLGDEKRQNAGQPDGTGEGTGSGTGEGAGRGTGSDTP